MTDVELKQAMAELQEVVRCRCDEAYRDRGLKDPHCECDSAEAVKIVADRIEALTKEREQWRRAAETRAEGWKISDDARIETEIKLAKAVDALEYYAVEALPWEADDSLRARTTLAEIKGASIEHL